MIMTNGIRASDFSDIASLVTGFPTTPYSSNSFENPNFYHPYDYTPPPSSPYIYHSLQPPPEPPYNFDYTTHIPTHLPLTNGLPGCFTYQAGFQPPLTSHPYNAQPIQSCYMSSSITTHHYQAGATFVQQSESFAPQVFDEIPNSHMQISDAIIDNMHQIEEKITKMLHTLENMGKIFADSPKLVEKKMEKRVFNVTNPVQENSFETEEENFRPDEMSPMVNHYSTTPAPLSVVNNMDSLSSLEKMIVVKDEYLNQLKVSQPYAPHVFDESPEKVYAVQIPDMPLYAPNSVAFPVKSIERALTTGLGIDFAMKDKETIYKVHEDERGKFEVLAESSEHICEPELLEKSKFNVSLKCFDGDGSLCKPVCLDSMSSQIDGVPRKELANRNVFISYAIKEFMLKESFNWFYCKSPNDVECFTTPTQLVAYNRCLAFLKDREIRACSPKYGLLVKLIIANSLTCFYLKHEIENSAMDLFEILPLNDVITRIELRIACEAIRFLYQVVRCFNWMAERKPEIYKPLFAEFCQYGRGSLPLKFFSTMVGKVPIFSVTSIANAYELLPETPKSETIQKIAIKLVLGSEECIESALCKLYSGSGQLEYATSFYKKVLVGVVILWDAVVMVFSMNGQNTNILKFCSWMKSEFVHSNNAIILGRKLSTYWNTLDVTRKDGVALNKPCYIHISSSLADRKEYDQTIRCVGLVEDAYLELIKFLKTHVAVSNLYCISPRKASNKLSCINEGGCKVSELGKSSFIDECYSRADSNLFKEGQNDIFDVAEESKNAVRSFPFLEKLKTCYVVPFMINSVCKFNVEPLKEYDDKKLDTMDKLEKEDQEEKYIRELKKKSLSNLYKIRKEIFCYRNVKVVVSHGTLDLSCYWVIIGEYAYNKKGSLKPYVKRGRVWLHVFQVFILEDKDDLKKERMSQMDQK